MGLFSFVGSVISAVSTVVSRCVPAIVNVAAKVIPVIGNVLSKINPIIAVVSRVAEGIGFIHNILKKDETVEDIGDRCLQAEDQGIKLDTYDTHAEYVDDIRDIELDPEKTESFTFSDKFLAGLGVIGSGIEEKFGLSSGDSGNLFNMVASSPEHFTTERLDTILNKGIDLESVVDYLNKDLNAGKAEIVENQLIEVEKEINPEISQKDVYKKLDFVSENYGVIDVTDIEDAEVIEIDSSSKISELVEIESSDIMQDKVQAIDNTKPIEMSLTNLEIEK